MEIFNNSNAFFNHWSSNAVFKIGLLWGKDGYCIIHAMTSKEKKTGAAMWENEKCNQKASRFAV